MERKIVFVGGKTLGEEQLKKTHSFGMCACPRHVFFFVSHSSAVFLVCVLADAAAGRRIISMYGEESGWLAAAASWVSIAFVERKLLLWLLLRNWTGEERGKSFG
jgi:hypothetical protein